MRMRRDHLSMRTEDIKALSKRIQRCSVDGLKRHENDKAPSTLIRFQTKTELFCSGYGYRPHYNAENDHRKRSFENALQSGAIWKRCFLKTLFSSVDGKNDAIWKRWRHQNHSTVSIQNGGQALPCNFNSCYWSWACCQIFFCLESHTNEAKGSIQSRIDPFASFACQTADNRDKSYFAPISRADILKCTCVEFIWPCALRV